MSLVTKGYGNKRMIITQGLGFWGKVKKIIKKVISRIVWLPVRREPFRMEIPVLGDVVFPFKQTIKVKGYTDKYIQLLEWLMEDEGEEE